MTQLAPHFSLEELTRSATAARLGIDNTPPLSIMPALIDTAHRLEAVRDLFGVPLVVHSGYRSPVVNHLDGGVPTSAHLTGRAVDFVVPGMTVGDAARRILAHSHEIAWDQLIAEYGWLHLSFAPLMRQQALTKVSAAAPYTLGINV